MFSCHVFLTGVKCKLGSGPSVLSHLVSVHDDFPAVSLERLHPVLCSYAGGVSNGLLGPERKPDGEIYFTKLYTQTQDVIILIILQASVVYLFTVYNCCSAYKKELLLL